MLNESRLLAGIGVVIAALLIYFLSSGVAFVAVYKFPDRAPRRIFRTLFWPLESLAVRSPWFSGVYNRFHTWCYATFVGKDGGERR